MKTITLFVLLLILTGCQSHLDVKMDKAKLIVDMKGYSKKDKKRKSAFKIYKDSNKHFFILKDDKIFYEDLKFVKVLNTGAGETNEYELQILDKNNHRKKITFKSDVTTFPMYGCGTADIMSTTSYHFSSYKKINGFNIFVNKVKGFNSAPQKSLALFENEKKKIEKLFFSNLKTEYSFSDSSGFRERYVLVLFQQDEKYGIAGKIKIVNEENKTKYSFKRSDTLKIFDKLVSVNGLLLVQSNSLVGYYGLSKIKYSSLEPFVYGLARFTLPNGTVGFLDRRGKEYFNNWTYIWENINDTYREFKQPLLENISALKALKELTLLELYKVNVNVMH